MDIQVISFIDRKSIDFQDMNYVFKEEDKEKSYIKEYYLFYGKKIEILFINNDNALKMYTSRKIKKRIILTGELQSAENINNENILFTGKKDRGEGNSIVLNQLLNKERINLKSLIMLLCDNQAYDNINSRKNIEMIITGSEERDKVVTNIVVNTLKEISVIQKCNDIELYLYTNEELNLQELIDIEDPICEYINCGKLKIKQYILNNNECKIYYSVLAKCK